MNVRFFNPGEAYKKIKGEVLPEIERVLEHGELILRDDVALFEKNLAEYVGTRYAVGVASGTDALFLTLKVLGIGEGDEVICPSYTFRATIEAIHMTGATPILTDLNEDWMAYKTERTKAIVPAHIAGEVLDWIPDEDVLMVEDACQAIGADKVEGIAACYSFYPAKLLGCYGDGGGVATNDEDLWLKLKAIRNHYKGDWAGYGWNSRLDNLQAAVLNIKIKHLPEVILRRKQIALRYDEAMPSVVKRPRTRNVYQDYIVAFRSNSEREQVYSFLQEHGIETMKNGYPFPAKSPKGKMTLNYEARSLRLPCNETLSDDEIEYVITKLHEFYE